LIFGLGDSEEVFMQCIQNLVNAGGKISLFAFTPVNGGKQPSLAAYRRVQAFRYLCESRFLCIEQCSFANGRLISFGLNQTTLVRALNDGDAFRTSGCGDCNRPYYNERPGQPFYNFPRPLYQPEFELAISQMEIFF
jgi:biotin synthase